MLQNLQWQSVLARDSRFDGAFVYAVRSTGIYCRPSCPSRRPQRDRVEFFADPTTAERAGFRACQRCRPETNEADPATAKVIAACKLIESAEEPPSLSDLANSVSLSPAHLLRSFQKLLGVTPREYADSLRLKTFKHELKESANVTHALYAAGYSSSSRVYEKASPQLGMTPLTYRNGGEGLAIRYTVGECDLGQVLLAATDKGVCAIKLGDSAQLIADLHARIPQCRDHPRRPRSPRLAHSRPQPSLRTRARPAPSAAHSLHRFPAPGLAGAPADSLRLDRQLFRRRQVNSQAARRSRRRSMPAPRNPVCLAIPCHRVIQRNGNHGGYRWGIERKDALLARESQSAESTNKKDEPPNEFRSRPRNAPPARLSAHRPH